MVGSNGFEKSCWEVWHSIDDLCSDRKNRQDAVESGRAARRARKNPEGEVDEEESMEIEDENAEESVEMADGHPPRPPMAGETSHGEVAPTVAVNMLLGSVDDYMQM